jgi:hypothetical protein
MNPMSLLGMPFDLLGLDNPFAEEEEAAGRDGGMVESVLGFDPITAGVWLVRGVVYAGIGAAVGAGTVLAAGYIHNLAMEE